MLNNFIPFQFFSKNTKLISQKYSQNYSSGAQLVRSEIYSPPGIVTIDSELRYFQYKILRNVLHLNKNLFIFGKTVTK